jgi:hypothetical protein
MLPARIEHLLAMGASMVLDHVEDLLPRPRAITDLLADRFAALVGANCYASFQGIQAFASHYDVHEVFAFQCAGEKRCRIYANRADAPLETPQGHDARARIDAAKGLVRMDVTTRLFAPGGPRAVRRTPTDGNRRAGHALRTHRADRTLSATGVIKPA